MLINPYLFSRLWTPADITTALWLDAADASTVTLTSGAVSQWNDKSGNGRNAVQSNASLRPTYASNAIVFTAQMLSVPVAAAQTNSRSLIAVFQTTTTFVGGDAGFITMQAADNPELRYGVRNGPTPSTGNNVRLYWNGGYALDGYNGAFTSGFSVFASELDGNTAPLTARLYKNGSAVASGSRNVASQGSFSQFTLGGYVGPGTQNGSLQELLTYTTNQTNRQLLEGYLAWKWNLQASLPGDHPYKSAAPTI